MKIKNDKFSINLTKSDQLINSKKYPYTHRKLTTDIGSIILRNQRNINLSPLQVQLTSNEAEFNLLTESDLNKEKIDQKHKDEFFVKNIDHKINLKKEIKIKDDEHYVKKTDKEYSSKLSFNTDRSNFINSNTNTNLQHNIEFDDLTRKTNIKNSMAKLAKHNLGSELKEFVRRTDNEQGCILLQNINIVKRKFDFTVFSKNSIKQNKKEEGKQNEANEDYKLNPSIDLQDPFYYFNILQNETNYSKLTSTEFYKQIVKTNIKTENLFRLEMINIAKKLVNKKIEKDRLKKINIDLHRDITKNKENFLLDCESHQIWKNKIENRLCEEKDVALLGSRPPSSRTNSILKKSNQFNLNNQILITSKKRDMELYRARIQMEEKNTSTSIQINLNKIQLDKFESEINELKQNLKVIMNEQKAYYEDLLHKGIDVRSDGLSWIIKRLMEFGTEIEKDKFPRFLEDEQINYLLDISIKENEISNLKILIKALKKKNHSKEFFFNTKQNIKTTPKTISKFSMDSNLITRSSDFGSEEGFSLKRKVHREATAFSTFYGDLYSDDINRVLETVIHNSSAMMASPKESISEEIEVK